MKVVIKNFKKPEEEQPVVPEKEPLKVEPDISDTQCSNIDNLLSSDNKVEDTTDAFFDDAYTTWQDIMPEVGASWEDDKAYLKKLNENLITIYDQMDSIFKYYIDVDGNERITQIADALDATDAIAELIENTDEYFKNENEE